jgi:MoaA/NifB/PqqE/SkfB family radical SAM enzyme
VSPVIESLPVVVLYPHSRCNCRCVMCDIWKATDQRDIGSREFERYIEDFQKLSVKWVVLSGGEPLMHSNLYPFCARLKSLGIRTTILSTGLLLERDARQIVEHVDDVIVSLDGPPQVHDRIRRISGAFGSLSRGVQALHRLRPGFPISGRSTVQRENFRYLRETAGAAKEIGLLGISFLAADVTSTAFNRPDGWGGERQAGIALSADELAELDAGIEALLAEWGQDPFLVDSPRKLRRIALHYRAHLGVCEPVPPRCNAPWTSAVIETDGTVRPCFFHAPIGHAEKGLASALNGPAAQAFRAGLDVHSNPICSRCVCSLYWNGS